MLHAQTDLVKHPVFAHPQEIVDIISPFDLGVMDAQDGERMQPEAYFVQAMQMRQYRAGYTHAMHEMATAKYPEVEPAYNQWGDLVK
jgi:hypothetical protein